MLRPFTLEDASDVQHLAGNWNVAQMVGSVPHPYPDGLAAKWIAGHAAAREEGNGYPFAVVHKGQLIGSVGLTQGSTGMALGYWIGEPWWGRGFATEAALRTVRFGFEDLRLDALVASHRVENDGSARVLMKCGFRYTHDGEHWSESLGRDVAVRYLALARDRFEAVSGPT